MKQLEALCDWLSRGPMTTRELAQRLGHIEAEGRTALYVAPSDPAWRRITISHDLDADAVTYVELELASPGALDLAALSQRFGAHTEPPQVHWDSPTRVHFQVDRGTGAPLRCRLVAEIQEGDGGPAKVRSVAIQPEPR